MTSPQLREDSREHLTEDHGQHEHAQARRDPGGHDQVADIARRVRAPGDQPADRRQDEKAKKTDDPVDDHGRDRLSLLDVHARQVSRLDQVAPHRARDHQVEHVADEAQEDRRAEGEPRVDDPHQEEPSEERGDEPDHVDRHGQPQQAEIERVAEDVAELVAIPPDHQSQQAEGQRHQGNIDDQAELRALCGVRHWGPLSAVRKVVCEQITSISK